MSPDDFGMVAGDFPSIDLQCRFGGGPEGQFGDLDLPLAAGLVGGGVNLENMASSSTAVYSPYGASVPSERKPESDGQQAGANRSRVS